MKAKRYPVKKKKLAMEEIELYLLLGKHEEERISKVTQLKDENIITIPQKATMQKNPFLTAMEEKWNKYD